MSTKIKLIQSFPDITFEKIKLGIDHMSMRDALVSSATKQDLEPTFRNLFRGVFYNGKTVYSQFFFKWREVKAHQLRKYSEIIHGQFIYRPLYSPPFFRNKCKRIVFYW